MENEKLNLIIYLLIAIVLINALCFIKHRISKMFEKDLVKDDMVTMLKTNNLLQIDFVSNESRQIMNFVKDISLNLITKNYVILDANGDTFESIETFRDAGNVPLRIFDKDEGYVTALYIKKSKDNTIITVVGDERNRTILNIEYKLFIELIAGFHKRLLEER